MEVQGGQFKRDAEFDAKSEFAFLRGSCMAILFIALWGINIQIFNVFHIDITPIFPAKLGERPVCTPRKIVGSACALLWTLVGSTFMWGLLFQGSMHGAHLLFYVVLFAIISGPAHQYTLFLRDFLTFFGKILYLVFFPGEEVHFIEVLVGDILTSLSKVFAEAGITLVALCDINSTILGYYSLPDALPALFASVPFLLRIRQCAVNYRASSSSKARFQHLLNIAKYFSSLPGLWIPILAGPKPTQATKNILLYCLLINSLYSFLWDVLMDWGLGQTSARSFGLRQKLLLGNVSYYYGAIVMDFGLRLAWVLKHMKADVWMPYDNFMLLIEVLEVFRRSMWTVLRVEWECLNKATALPRRPSDSALV